MMAMDSRQARRMLQRMGVNLEEIQGVEEVIIKTSSKNIVIRKASVSEIKAKGMRVFQVSGEDVEEVEKQKPRFGEEDIMLVAQQTGVSREKSETALVESDGDLARAILKLKT